MERYERTLEVTYEEESGMGYLYLFDREEEPAVHSYPCEEMPGLPILDFDDADRLFGVEFFATEQMLPDWEIRHTYERADPPPESPRSRWFRWLRGSPPPARPKSRVVPIRQPVELTYDDATDVAYVRLSPEPAAEVRSRYSIDRNVVDRDITLEFGDRSELIGIEVAEASKALARRLLPDES